MAIGLSHYLIVAALLFTIGVFGIFINRKNVIVILMSIELILLSVNINFVAFSVFLGNLVGQVFALLILTVAAAIVAALLLFVFVMLRLVLRALRALFRGAANIFSLAKGTVSMNVCIGVLP